MQPPIGTQKFQYLPAADPVEGFSRLKGRSRRRAPEQKVPHSKRENWRSMVAANFSSETDLKFEPIEEPSKPF
jgi:hypothetical protein